MQHPGSLHLTWTISVYQHKLYSAIYSVGPSSELREICSCRSLFKEAGLKLGVKVHAISLGQRFITPKSRASRSKWKSLPTVIHLIQYGFNCLYDLVMPSMSLEPFYLVIKLETAALATLVYIIIGHTIWKCMCIVRLFQHVQVHSTK